MCCAFTLPTSESPGTSWSLYLIVYIFFFLPPLLSGKLRLRLFPHCCLNISGDVLICVLQPQTEKKFVSQADSSLRTRCQDFWDDVEGQGAMYLKYHIAFWMFYISSQKWCWNKLGFLLHCMLLLMRATITGSNYSLCYQTGLTLGRIMPWGFHCCPHGLSEDLICRFLAP